MHLAYTLVHTSVYVLCVPITNCQSYLIVLYCCCCRMVNFILLNFVGIGIIVLMLVVVVVQLIHSHT